MTHRGLKVLQILTGLGREIAACDEEALFYLSREHYEWPVTTSAGSTATDKEREPS